MSARRFANFAEIPDVVIELIDRPDEPAVGAGEATNSAIPPAIGNAIFDAIGVRLRRVPFTADRVKTALSSVERVSDAR